MGRNGRLFYWAFCWPKTIAAIKRSSFSSRNKTSSEERDCRARTAKGFCFQSDLVTEISFLICFSPEKLWKIRRLNPSSGSTGKITRNFGRRDFRSSTTILHSSSATSHFLHGLAPMSRNLLISTPSMAPL